MMARSRSAQVRFGVVSLDAHQAHQSLSAFAIDPEYDGHLATAVERVSQVKFVDLALQPEVLGTLWASNPVVG